MADRGMADRGMAGNGGAVAGNHDKDVLVPAKAPEGFRYRGIDEHHEATDGLVIDQPITTSHRLIAAASRPDLERSVTDDGEL
jgi:hypothetical protein